MDTVESMKTRIEVAMGERPADLVFTGGRVVNVFTGEILGQDVALCGGMVAAVGSGYRGRETVSLQGEFLLPGFIDGHLHIESSTLTPSGLAGALAPHGCTALVADPHEIANVMGLPGIRFMLEDSKGAPLDVFFTAPSCVPATEMETSGATLGAEDLTELLQEPRILGLAEMMNYPGVLMGAPPVLQKLVLFQDRILDGHSPLLTGAPLQAYVSSGIRSDHETTSLEEGREKLSSGMFLMIREASSARNLETLLPLLTPLTSPRICFVSDDLHPEDIATRGHLDGLLRKAVSLGVDPVLAIQAVTVNPARYFRLYDRGAIAPGYRADLVLIEDLKDFRVKAVYKDGVKVAEEGRLVHGKRMECRPLPPLKNMLLPTLSRDRLRIPHKGGKARVIGIHPGQILTHALSLPVPSKEGYVVADPDQDILPIHVIERHHGTGCIGHGLVKGFGLREGALASTVAHDSHNVIVVGPDTGDRLAAVLALAEMGGGLCAVRGGKVLARLPLEVAGLMTSCPLADVVRGIEDLKRACKDLGCVLDEPFMTLSFLALPVIPELKLSDLGLIDTLQFTRVPLFMGG